jgi:quercetin dioxygenase-like cupin family protein
MTAPTDAEWHSAGEDAGSFAVLRVAAGGGVTVLNRMGSGEAGDLHAHDADEELIVVTGTVLVGGERLGPGGYLCLPAGTAHRAVAEADCLFVTVLHDTPTPGATERRRAEGGP